MSIHRFREEDILEFIKHHLQEINLVDVDQMWFLDLLLLKGLKLQGTAVSPHIEDEDGSDDVT